MIRNKKGITLVVAIMIATILLITLSGVIFMMNHNRNTVWNNISDTRLAYMTESGLNLGLTWLKSQTRNDFFNSSSKKKFPVNGGDDTTYVFKIQKYVMGNPVTVELGRVKVSGKRNGSGTVAKWDFKAECTLGGKTCVMEAKNITPATVTNDGGGINFPGINNSKDGAAKIKVGEKDFKLHETGQVTVMCWIKWNANQRDKDKWSNIIANCANNDTKKGQFWLQHDMGNNRIEFALNNGSNNRVYIHSAKEMEDDKWYHIAASYNNKEMRIYVNGDYNRWSWKYNTPKIDMGKECYAYEVWGYKDGVQKGITQTRADELLAWQAGLHRDFVNKGIKEQQSTGNDKFTTFIGAMAGKNVSGKDEGYRNFRGRIDDVSIWNKALSEDEIRSYRVGSNKINGTEDGLQACWTFDEFSSGATIGNSTKIKNIKKIKKMVNGEEKWVDDTSLDAEAVWSGDANKMTAQTNTGENREDDNIYKPVGEIKRDWSISYK